MIVSYLAMMLLFAAQDAPVAPSAPDPTVTELGEVQVTGERLTEASRTFVQQVAGPPRGTRPGRWHKPICVSVSGVRSDAAQFLIDRVSGHALALGLDVGQPGCKPNVIVMMTADGAALADHLVTESPAAFQITSSSSSLGRAELRTFRTSAAPVRWWNVSMPVFPDTGALAVNLPGGSRDMRGELGGVEVHGVSRLRSNVRYDLAWTIVVVDMSKTGGVPLGALSDYVSMVALAQIDADAELADYPSILNLFQDRAPVTAWTDWDSDYLKALYTSREDRATARQQQNDLVHALVSEHRESQSAPSE